MHLAIGNYYDTIKHVQEHVILFFYSYIEGKHKETVHESAVYDKRLYLVSGRKYSRAACVSLM